MKRIISKRRHSPGRKQDSDALDGRDSATPCRHLAIMVDGNGRWAVQRRLPRLYGHAVGAQNVFRILDTLLEQHVPIVTFYVFSTENWGRPKHEVKGIMEIIEATVRGAGAYLLDKGIQFRAIGDAARLPSSLREAICSTVALTCCNERLMVNLAINYGGRAEILDAARRIMLDNIPPERIDEHLFSEYLSTRGLPDPDLVVRTGGHMRLSNFMLWQTVESRFYVTPTLWPDFDRDELIWALWHHGPAQRPMNPRAMAKFD